jgi:ribose transport system permease protein
MTTQVRESASSRWIALRALSFSRISGVYVWAALVLIFALWVPSTFLTGTTWTNLLSSQAVTAMVTLSLMLPLMAGAYDLSAAQMVGLSAALSAYLAHHGIGSTEAIIVGLLAGVAVGLVNAGLVVGLRMNSFIATLGTSSVLMAATGILTNEQEIVGVPSGLQSFGSRQIGVAIPVWYLVIMALIFAYVLERAPFGRYLFAIGHGREAARLAGLRVNMYTAISLVICSVGSAFAGVVLLGRVGAAEPNLGTSYLLPAYAAAFLGATQFKRRVNVPGALLATYLLATGITGLQLAGAASWVQDLFYGVALIAAVGLSLHEGHLPPLRRQRRRGNISPAGPTADDTDRGGMDSGAGGVHVAGVAPSGDRQRPTDSS